MNQLGRRHAVTLPRHGRSHYRPRAARPPLVALAVHVEHERPWPVYLAGFAAGTAIIALFTAAIVTIARLSA